MEQLNDENILFKFEQDGGDPSIKVYFPIVRAGQIVIPVRLSGMTVEGVSAPDNSLSYIRLNHESLRQLLDSVSQTEFRVKSLES